MSETTTAGRRVASPAPEAETCVAHVDDHVVLRASGPDAAAFLQGQLTCDVREVEAGTSRLGAWCSPKGRVLALVRLLLDGPDQLSMIVHRSLAERVRDRLRMYVLRARVTLDGPDPRQALIGLGGPGATARLDDAGLPTPVGADAVADRAGIRVVRLAGSLPAFLLVGERTAVQVLGPRLGVPGSPGDSAAWSAFEVRAGLPRVTAETSDAYLPQMLNLDALDAVSFRKGCYVGQEIVARTQHLGRLKRRMYRAHADGADLTSVSAGAALGAPADDDGEPVGRVLCADPTGGGLLIVARIDAVEAGSDLWVEDRTGARHPVRVADVPYPVARL